MRLLKIFGVLVVLACVAAVAVVAQDRPADRSANQGFAWNMLVGGGAHLGVSARDLEPAEADRQKLTGGAVVEDIQPDSPASRAGLKRADVIVEFDGERVRSAQQFSRLVQETPAGRTVKAAIVRDGQRSEVQLTPSRDRRAEVYIDGDRMRDRFEGLAARMPEFNFDFEMPGPPGAARGRLGVTVSPLTDQLATYFGAREGVLVSAVASGSAAERAGLKAGDVVTTVNGAPVRSSADITRALRNAGENADVTIGIVREKKESSLKAKIEAERLPRSARPI